MGKIKEFIAREKEKRLLKNALDEHTAGICVFGTRRVGKTALIKNVLTSFDPESVIYFECVKGSYGYNLELLAREAARVLALSYISKLRDIFDIFEAIERESNGRHMIVVIDEYPYMREKLDASLDSYIQRIIDNSRGKISLVLSGSYIDVMKEMVEAGSPLFGRIARAIEVLPFSYIDAARFYPSLPVRDKIAFYAVFGGYPFALAEIDEGLSLYENIASILLDEGNLVRLTLENVLLPEAGRSGLPQETLARIGNSRMKYSEIEDLMSLDVSGTLDRSLKRLIKMDIIEKTSPINKHDDKKKTFYEIQDNLLRFFFTYIMPNKAMIARVEANDFISEMIEPSLNTFVSKRFEGIVKEYFALVSSPSVLEIGSYWYDDKKTRTNGEFDCVLKLKDKSYQVFEVKYLKERMTHDLYEREKEKMRSIPALDISSYGFVSSSGFGFATEDEEGIFIDGDEIYQR